MNPTIGYQLSQYHLADLRHQAQHGAVARAARRARRARPPQGRDRLPALPALGRRVLAVLGARST